MADEDVSKPDIVYFDLETQRSMNDVQGIYQDLGMSVGVTYSTRLGEYRVFAEKEAEQLIEQLLEADLVVGYNHINFDYKVLEAYTILDLSSQLRSLDMLVEAEKILGHRLPLEAFAQGSLGVGKIASGIDAIKWWREGKIFDIAKYCCFDVKVTKLVHQVGAARGELYYLDRFQRRQRMEVPWK